jgi:ribosome-associated protein
MSFDQQFIQLRTGEMIPFSALEFSTSRSGGPGGQNVNKVETKVEVRMQIDGSQWLEESTRERLMLRLASRIDNSGAIRIASSTERTQRGNRIAVVERLARILDVALTPEKPRRATKATAGSKRRRVETKRKAGEKKSARKWRPEE